MRGRRSYKFNWQLASRRLIIGLILLTISINTTCHAFTSPRIHYPRIITTTTTLNSAHNNPLSSSSSSSSVLCIGEVLFDSLPSGIYLGGAPTNVAIHLASLGTTTAISASLGNDNLGDDVIRRLENSGVRTHLLQRTDIVGTGMVIASIDEMGDAAYEFDTPAAWDFLKIEDDLISMATNARVVVMGSLAMRLGGGADDDDERYSSANTLGRIRRLAREDSVVFDVNLRPPWYTPEIVTNLARDGPKLAMLKLNDDELEIMETWYGLTTSNDDDDGLKTRMEKIAKETNTNRVCVTRGDKGAALLLCREGIFVEHAGFEGDEDGSDTVGAGDAFLAALIRSLLLEGETPERALARGCALGGYVARCRGATPRHEEAPVELRDIFSFQ